MQDKRIVVLVGPEVDGEQVQGVIDFFAEREENVALAAAKAGTVATLQGETLEQCEPIAEVNAADIAALVIPGGRSPEVLRQNDDVLKLTRECLDAGDAFLCAIERGPQVLISARVLAGRTATAHPSIRDDVALAGARLVDKKVVVDGRLLTSRKTADLPALLEALATAITPVQAEA